MIECDWRLLTFNIPREKRRLELWFCDWYYKDFVASVRKLYLFSNNITYLKNSALLGEL